MNEEALKLVHQIINGGGKDVVMKLIDTFRNGVNEENKTGKPITAMLIGAEDGRCTCFCTDELTTMSDENKIKTMNMIIDLLTCSVTSPDKTQE